ncbi:MAG: alanine dehydrogenase [Candidatus Bathyarchaeia archaeon]|jgi:alanine dehydrogenase
MIIGIPSEVKSGENRVALTPQAVESLKENGHRIVVEKDAGVASGFANEDYIRAGAEITDSHEAIFESDLIVKVKEILPQEFGILREGKIIMAYLHFTEGLLTSKRPLADALMKAKVIAFSYDTVQSNGSTPLLAPMSEIAGHNGVIMGAYHLQTHLGGEGVMIGRMAGCRPAEVVIIGGGSVGTGAAKAAVGLGANVTILDVNVRRLNELNEIFANKVTTLVSDTRNVEESVKKADLVINGVFFNPLRTRKRIVTKEMVSHMKPGAVIVDIGCDPDGPIETCQETHHDHPTFIYEGVIHYCVPNVPGAVPRTASQALSNAILPYVRDVANKGWVKAVRENAVLRTGLNIANGVFVHMEGAACQKMEYHDLEEFLKEKII